MPFMPCCPGVLLPWCPGVLVSWCPGVLVSVEMCALVPWCPGSERTQPDEALRLIVGLKVKQITDLTTPALLQF